MPEGHTIHRLAADHARLLAGRQVAVSSPQGRFAEGAALVDGRRLLATDAYGKHLFYRWSAGVSVRVHLGLYGRYTTLRVDEATPPSPQCRLQLRADDVVVRLSGPTACEVIDPAAEAALVARLGPDPLRADADPARAYAALRRRRAPVGAALLDQRVVAGLGNVFRAEALFACRIHPDRPANAVTPEEFDALWATLATMLRAGLRANRIDTVADAPVAADIAAHDGRRGRPRVWVYGRGGAPCLRCGTPIRAWQLAARTISACPTCQPR